VPQWGGFLAVVAVLTAVLLVLARQSQQVLREQASQSADRSAATHDTTSATVGGTGKMAVDDTTAVDGTSETAVDSTAESGVDDTSETATESVSDTGAVDELSERVVGKSEHAGGAHIEDSPAVEAESTETMELSSGALLANVAFTQGLVAAVVVAAGWYFSIPASAFGVVADPLGAGALGVAVGLAFGVALWVANESSTAVADAVGATYDESVRQLLAPTTGRGWLVLFALVLPLIALAEELLFRAALIGVPDAAGIGVSPWLLAVVASLAFALGHGAQGRVGVVVTGLLGFALAAGYILTGSLLVVVVAHYAVNALEFGVHELFGVDLV
jgi:membrane protease YdiL (CAAX protease family)